MEREEKEKDEKVKEGKFLTTVILSKTDNFARGSKLSNSCLFIKNYL